MLTDGVMPARLPPFSLAEFRALVSEGLNSDAPVPALPLTLSPSPFSPSPSLLSRKKSLPNLPHAPPSRIRILLTKLNKRVADASALVKRRRSSVHGASYKAPLCVPTSFADSDAGGDRSSTDSLSLFTPYLPLAVQYERAVASESVFFAPSPSPASDCTSESSHLHAPPPPSPTASSFSDASIYISPYCSDTDHPCSLPDSPFSPYNYNDTRAGTQYENSDPFAKGTVRVVHHSCEALWLNSGSPARSGSTTSRIRTRRGNGRRVKPGATAQNEEDGEVEEGVDDSGICLPEEKDRTTLDRDLGRAHALPTPPPSPSPSLSSNHIAATSPRPPPASLTRAPTARTYPLPTLSSSSPRLRRTKRRPSSPFPLSLTRSATTTG
ncbi:hypothetical protein B0H19DRAFT_1134948 [Mycena capillaripes]|nr:hypothetical protein B0H19DRAFT_1134948 [Mycena capillaripes]